MYCRSYELLRDIRNKKQLYTVYSDSKISIKLDALLIDFPF